jgi:hypothetical protein
VPFKYVPSLASGETINLRAGLQTLADERPEDDRSATESIADVPDKVTAKLIEDFRASQVFATLDFPIQQDKDDLILQGAIKRFYWKMKPSPITFIPVINLVLYFGVPARYVDGIASLCLRVIRAKTGQTLAEYEKSSTRTENYTLYSFKAGEAGAELAEAFRDVVKQIKDAITTDGKVGRFVVASTSEGRFVGRGN